MTSVMIGNLLALFAACFTLASALSARRKPIYLYQTAQCLIMAAANAFFLSFSGVTTFLLCALRNGFLAYDRFTGRRCLVFAVSVALIGLASNNRGLVGLLPVITTVLYTAGCLYAEKAGAIKLNIAVNLALWALYEILIRDYVSFAVDTASAAAALVLLAAMQSGEQQVR